MLKGSLIKLGSCGTVRLLGFMLVSSLYLAASGCTDMPTADLYNPTLKPPTQQPTVYDDKPWAVVLLECVKEGLVDYKKLAADPSSLDAYLNYVMFVGPKTAPGFFNDDDSRLAYYLNVYNACVLKTVIARKIPETIHDLRLRKLEYNYRFKIDGDILVLATLREMIRRESKGNARVEFAMCDGAIGSPPLPSKPFRPQNLDEMLRRLAQEAMDNPNMVQVDHERQYLLVAQPLWHSREVFKAMYVRETNSSSATMLNCLMHMASGNRRQYLARATGYELRILPFDRKLNVRFSK